MSRRLVEKAKRLLEREVGTVYAPLEGRLRFALAFPGIYRLGMSSLGLQIVYGMLNSMPGVTCERVFLPDLPDVLEYRRSRTRLFTLESQTPVAQFDVLAFSISYELDYASVAQILDLSGLPILSKDRDESHPLVIAGGPCATFNPEPLAGIIDTFAIGDAEELVPEMVRILQDCRSPNRDDLLAQLAQIQGIYVPRFYTPQYNSDGTLSEMKVSPPALSRVTKRVTRDLSSHSSLAVILTPEAEFSDMLLVEAMRGCKRQCRFCVSGYCSLPPRPRPLSKLPEDKRIGLIGSAVFDHPQAQAICKDLTDNGREFSVSSIRIESLTDDLAQAMYKGGQRTLTIAPEAATQRLRDAINKPTTHEEILDAARMAEEAGFSRLKLYFMVGLPGETREDVEAIPQLVSEISAGHPSLRLQVSVSCFVPKPWTPFQWCSFAPERELAIRIAIVRRAVAAENRVELSSESPRAARVQAWLARGDRRLTDVIVRAASPGMDYSKAAIELNVDTSFWSDRQRDKDEVFPWDHIDLLVGKEYLWNEYLRAQDGLPTPGCNVGTCARCGVC